MARTLRIGWIGAFREAESYYLPSLAEWGDVEIAALCHPDEEQAARLGDLFRIKKTFSSPGTMLRQAEVDAVFVNAPVEQAAPILEAALHRRLPVCADIGTVLDLDVAKKILKTAIEAGVPFNVLFPKRHIALLRTLRAEVEKRGAVSCVTVTLHSPPASTNAAENHLLNHIEWVSAVDLLRRLGGVVNSFSGVVGKYYDSPTPNALSALLHYQGGGTGVLLSDRVAGIRREEVEIHGRGVSAVLDLRGHGRVIVDGGEPVLHHHQQTSAEPVPERVMLGHQAAARRFIDAMLVGRETDTNLVEAIRTMELLRRIEGTAPSAMGAVTAAAAG